jgi:hypothetical protein
VFVQVYKGTFKEVALKLTGGGKANIIISWHTLNSNNKYHCASVNDTWSASKIAARPNLTFCESPMPHKPLETHATGCKLHQNFF